jgi:hypothetical protein
MLLFYLTYIKGSLTSWWLIIEKVAPRDFGGYILKTFIGEQKVTA